MTVLSTSGACARAALAGNPSDMFGGAVLAVPVTSLCATVTASNFPGGGRHGPHDARPLVDAALTRLDRLACDVWWDTEIPRSVGLAGSSALIIATLRAADGAPRDPYELALLALAIERDDLGIAAGLQDRAVQAFEAAVLVDLAATPIVRVVSPAAPLEFVVAWLPAAAGDSGDHHRDRTAGRAGMAKLARVARDAADAFVGGDAEALEVLMGESAAVRRDIAPLPNTHEVLADAVTRAGLTPNSTGSGGAVVAVLHDAASLGQLHRELDAIGASFVTERFG